MGSASRSDTLPQQALPSAVTLSAALPYLSFTICLRSGSLIAALSRGAAGVALGQLEALRRLGAGDLVLEIVVEVVDLPLDTVGILHPELVLVGVAAVDAHLLTDGEPRRLHAGEVGRHRVHRVHLDAHVIDRALGGMPALRPREIDRRPVGQELHVARLDLDGVRAEEALVEVAALAQIRYVHVQMNLRAHGLSPFSSRR